MDELDIRLFITAINISIIFFNIYMIAKLNFGWKKMYFGNKEDGNRYFSNYCKEVDKNFNLQVEVYELKARLHAINQINQACKDVEKETGMKTSFDGNVEINGNKNA